MKLALYDHHFGTLKGTLATTPDGKIVAEPYDHPEGGDHTREELEGLAGAIQPGQSPEDFLRMVHRRYRNSSWVPDEASIHDIYPGGEQTEMGYDEWHEAHRQARAAGEQIRKWQRR